MSMKMNAYRLFKSEFPVTNRLLLVVSIGIALLGVKSAHATPNRNLNYTRVHLVDNSADSRNWLFRGNFPGNNGSYAYTELIQDLHKRARDEGNASLPDDFELHVINFNNPTDPDFFLEKSFFYQNPSKGDLTIWPLVEALLPPQSVGSEIREFLIKNPDILFIVDELPFRLQKVYDWVHSQQRMPQVLYWHCEHGCDRTGEASGAYYMKYMKYNVTEAFDRNTRECGRPQDTHSKDMLGWFCLYLEQQTGSDYGSCLDF